MCDNDQECTPVVPGSITPEPLPVPGGGGGGTTDFNQLTNRPKYGGVRMSGTTDIPNIEGLIPSAATSANKLADQAFVNSSVATNTAYFVGTFNTIEELEAVENPSNNDYGFVITTDSAGNTVYNRYKFNSDTNAWVFEYALNNSSFTAAQWAAIQSGITSGGVDKLESLALIESVGEGLNLDQNGELSFDKSLIGAAKVLTEDDYNWHSTGEVDDNIAAWLLPDGLYVVKNSPIVWFTTSDNYNNVTFVKGTTGSGVPYLLTINNAGSVAQYTLRSNGLTMDERPILKQSDIINNLTSTSTTSPLSANQGKVLKDMIDNLPTGGVTELTTADYNYPADNPTSIALWLLEPGFYVGPSDSSVNVYPVSGISSGMGDGYYNAVLVTRKAGNNNRGSLVWFSNNNSTYYTNVDANGWNYTAQRLSTTVTDALTSTSTTNALSANQGKVLKDMIDALPTGGITELTTDDYDYPDDNPRGVALWRLDGGLYKTSGDVTCYVRSSTTITPASGETILILKAPASISNQVRTFIMLQGSNSANLPETYVVNNSGSDVLQGNRWATLSNIYADPAERTKIRIGDGATAPYPSSVALGAGATTTGQNASALGAYSTAAENTVAFYGGSAATKGIMQIGLNRTGFETLGYNNSPYRLLSGLYDGQSAHDAATYGQVISYAAINGAGAPTTATEGKYVGQLYYDTTNEAMYFLKTIDTTTDPATYTWETLGGGSSVNVVQTTGTSTTDVMSQNAVTGMVFADPTTKTRIQIGAGASTDTGDEIAIGPNATCANFARYAITLGHYAVTYASSGVAIGENASCNGSADYSVALGSDSKVTQKGQVDISTLRSANTHGYNNSQYRLLTGLYDPQSAHDAATKGYVDTAVAGAGANEINSTDWSALWQ